MFNISDAEWLQYEEDRQKADKQIEKKTPLIHEVVLKSLMSGWILTKQTHNKSRCRRN